MLNKEEVLDILMLLSNVETIVGVKELQKEMPEWLAERLDSVIALLVEKLKK